MCGGGAKGRPHATLLTLTDTNSTALLGTPISPSLKFSSITELHAQCDCWVGVYAD